MAVQAVFYGFEAPQFIAGQTTPFLNVAPSAGPSGFLASFVSSPSPDAFHIGTVLINPAFVGQNLMDVSLPGSSDTLTISLSQPVNSVRLDFALFEPGWLFLQCPAGSTNAYTAPESQAGSLGFSSANPFSAFSLTGYNTQGTPIMLGIDNLQMTVVPEPATGQLVLAGAASWAWSRRRFARS